VEITQKIEFYNICSDKLKLKLKVRGEAERRADLTKLFWSRFAKSIS